MNRSILIVEDESIVAMEIADYVRRLGLEVIATVDNAKQACELASQRKPDLVLMDISLKGSGTGIDAASCIRETQTVPIIYMTAFTDTGYIDRAVATRPSAYLSKPINQNELTAAIKIALSDAHDASEAAHRVALDDLMSYRPQGRLLFDGEQEVVLSRREGELLELLIEHRESIVQIDTLENVIWPDLEPNENRRRALVSRLRSKLRHRLLFTYAGIGYSLRPL